MEKLSVEHFLSVLDKPQASLKTTESAIGIIDDDAQAASVWLRSKASNSKNTFDSYKREATRLLLWLNEHNLKLNTMKVDDVHAFYLRLANPPGSWIRPRKQAKGEVLKPTQVLTGPLSAKSISYTRNVLGGMFDFLVTAGYVRYNVFKLSMTPSTVDYQTNLRSLQKETWFWFVSWLFKREAKNARDKARLDRDRWLIMLLYHTGIRRSEASDGVMGDFIKLDAGWVLRVIGKGNKERLISANSILLDELMHYRQSLKLDPLPYPSEASPLVCSMNFNRGLQPVTPRNIGLTINLIGKQAASDCDDEYIRVQLQSMSTHWLRHTNATHRLAAGASLETTQDELGHADPRTTRIYAKTIDTKRHEDAEKLADMQPNGNY